MPIFCTYYSVTPATSDLFYFDINQHLDMHGMFVSNLYPYPELNKLGCEYHALFNAMVQSVVTATSTPYDYFVLEKAFTMWYVLTSQFSNTNWCIM